MIGVNWLGNRSDTTNLSFRNEIRVMSVSEDDIATKDNSYKPYQAYLFYGDYPLTRSIYILLNDPRNALPWGFASFLTSDKGQRIILKSQEKAQINGKPFVIYLSKMRFLLEMEKMICVYWKRNHCWVQF